MEHGSTFFNHGGQTKSSSDSNPLQVANPSINTEALSNPNNVGVGNVDEAPSNPNNVGAGSVEQPMAPHNIMAMQGRDQFLPIANLMRIMRCVLPANAKVSDDTKETMQSCVSQFISFITSEANDRCQLDHRKIVTAEDILWAMEKLGFNDYVGPLVVYLQRYRKSQVEPLVVHHKGHVPPQQIVAGCVMPPLPPLQPPRTPYRPNLPAMAITHGLNEDGSSTSGSHSGGAMTNVDHFNYLP